MSSDTIDTKALRERISRLRTITEPPLRQALICELGLEMLEHGPAILDAADRLAHIESLADTRSAESFAALSDEDKLRWWIVTGQRDKEIRDRLAALEESNTLLSASLKQQDAQIDEMEAENERLKQLLSDIKEWDIDGFGKRDTLLALPVELRQRIEALAAGGANE